jgi:hypothetical protein
MVWGWNCKVVCQVCVTQALWAINRTTTALPINQFWNQRFFIVRHVFFKPGYVIFSQFIPAGEVLFLSKLFQALSITTRFKAIHRLYYCGIEYIYEKSLRNHPIRVLASLKFAKAQKCSLLDTPSPLCPKLSLTHWL